jgi:hypothetical protein
VRSASTRRRPSPMTTYLDGRGTRAGDVCGVSYQPTSSAGRP